MTRARRNWKADPAEGFLLAQVRNRTADVEAAYAALNAAALDAREAGIPWRALGEAMGMTEQGAQQRYGRGGHR